jgi:hypothetical protein
MRAEFPAARRGMKNNPGAVQHETGWIIKAPCYESWIVIAKAANGFGNVRVTQGSASQIRRVDYFMNKLTRKHFASSVR